MKTVKLEVFNGTTQFINSFEVHGQLGVKKVIGSTINRLFEYNERLKKYGASHFKYNTDLSIVISVDGEPLLDSYELNSQYGFRLRFGSAAKSKRKFANCLNDLMNWAAAETKIVSIEELIESLK